MKPTEQMYTQLRANLKSNTVEALHRKNKKKVNNDFFPFANTSKVTLHLMD